MRVGQRLCKHPSAEAFGCLVLSHLPVEIVRFAEEVLVAGMEDTPHAGLDADHPDHVPIEVAAEILRSGATGKAREPRRRSPLPAAASRPAYPSPTLKSSTRTPDLDALEIRRGWEPARGVDL